MCSCSVEIFQSHTYELTARAGTRVPRAECPPRCFASRQRLALIRGWRCSPLPLTILSRKMKHLRILCTWKCCGCSLWVSVSHWGPALAILPVRPGPPQPAPWAGRGRGGGQSEGGTLGGLGTTRQPTWELIWKVASKYSSHETPGQHFSAEIFQFSDIMGWEKYGKSLSKKWNCSQKADT